MQEIFTEAIVLDAEPAGELDVRVHLYTKELGRVAAKATSARKILSKLNAHLQPLSLIGVRLLHKNNFQIVDALKKEKLPPTFLKTAHLVKEMTTENDPDFSLWSVLLFLIQKKTTDIGLVLNVLGYSSEFANCAICAGSPNFFSVKRLDFYCQNCCPNIDQASILLQV